MMRIFATKIIKHDRKIGAHPSDSGVFCPMVSLSSDARENLMIPSGKHTKNYGKSPSCSWVNQRFLWAMVDAWKMFAGTAPRTKAPTLSEFGSG